MMDLSLQQGIYREICMTEEYRRQSELDRTRPSVLFRPTLSIDGNQWCALYGSNLQEGVAGFGDSPDLAMQDFDRHWTMPIEQARKNADEFMKGGGK